MLFNGRSTRVIKNKNNKIINKKKIFFNRIIEVADTVGNFEKRVTQIDLSNYSRWGIVIKKKTQLSYGHWHFSVKLHQTWWPICYLFLLLLLLLKILSII